MTSYRRFHLSYQTTHLIPLIKHNNNCFLHLIRFVLSVYDSRNNPTIQVRFMMYFDFDCKLYLHETLNQFFEIVV